MAEKPAAELTEEDKRFILERFFDVNWKKILARYPRYQELLDKRGSGDAASINKALETFHRAGLPRSANLVQPGLV